MTRLSGGWSWSRGASCSALAQLLCLALVAHSAWAQNASAPTNATASTGGEKYDLIVVLKVRALG